MHHTLLNALDSLVQDDDLVAAVWTSLDLVEMRGTASLRPDTGRLIRQVVSRDAYRDDFLFHVTALALMGRLGGPHARRELLAVASAGDPAARPYSALALTGNVTPEAIPVLCGLLHARDPFTRMAAQEALVSVPPGSPAAPALTAGLKAVIIDAQSPEARIAAIECILPAHGVTAWLPLLDRIARDSGEPNGVRAAARRAMGRLGLTGCTSRDVVIGDEKLFLPTSSSGWHIAQLTTGSTSGLQTLTSGLAAAFQRRGDVDSVLNISYGPGEHAISGDSQVHISSGGPVAWDHRLRIEREMDRLLHRHHSHVIHLRFADVGTIAAARSAQRQGIRVYFTFAPDPILPMRLAAERGDLSRATLREHDLRDRLIFRTGILHRMTRDADGLALLPRADDTAERLLSGAFGGPTRRIAEGIDLHPTARVGGEVAIKHPRAYAAAPLYGGRPAPERRGYPLLVTVGRLHPAKGMATLVETWAATPDLVRSTNLVIVGGNLAAPDGTERAVLDDIERIVAAHPAAAGGLILTGAVPHRDVPSLLETLTRGIVGFCAPRSVYVCSSPKEEFGLAILEALAAGLAVVAPRAGGPATYLRDGILGFLADTTDSHDLARALRRALELRADPSAYARMGALGQDLVRTRYSIDRMADELIALYGAGSVAALSPAS